MHIMSRSILLQTAADSCESGGLRPSAGLISDPAAVYLRFCQSSVQYRLRRLPVGLDHRLQCDHPAHQRRRRDPSLSLEEALNRTIQTYGKSIIYIAGTLVLGLLVWVLSPLKFQAQMGMMLAVILFLNCLGAVFLVPVLILLFKPKFD